MKKVGAFLGSVLLVSLLGSGAVYAAPADGEPGVTISGPVCEGAHGWAYGAYFGDIGKYNYIEEEYFLSGTAQSWRPVGELAGDGAWTVELQDAEPYETRILVRRPADASEFNGTVIVEWADMGSGYELTYSEAQGIYENGFAYVSVTADQEGAAGLREWDQPRYGELDIPNAGMACDIFTQAAQAVGPQRQTGGNDPMGGLAVERMIAVGVSDAGSAVLSYANAVQPVEHTFDGLIIAVCGGEARDLDGGADPVGTLVRSDLTVPVLVLNSQSEALGYAQYRQPDTSLFRSWEIAGAAHAPDRQSRFLRQKTDRDGITDAAERESGEYLPNEVNWLYTLDAAYLRMHEWITEGAAPQSFEPIAIENNAYVLDEYGNVLGGVRLPELEIPAGRYIARPDLPEAGYTIRFSEEELTGLYPTHEDYAAKVSAAAAEAENAGVILSYRTAEYGSMAAAASVPVPLRPDISNPLVKYLCIAAAGIVLVIAAIAALIVWRVRAHKKKKSGQGRKALKLKNAEETEAEK